MTKYNSDGTKVPGTTWSPEVKKQMAEEDAKMQQLVQKAAMRQFETGATRSPDAGKLDYAGFLSPFALEHFAKYMQKHQTQEDGKPRASDNWKKGIPIDSYHKSMIRHVVDYMLAYEEGNAPKVEELLDAIWFNVQGQLHERTKGRVHFTEGDRQPKPAPKSCGGDFPEDEEWLKQWGPVMEQYP
jgi:hypothetical protein